MPPAERGRHLGYCAILPLGAGCRSVEVQVDAAGAILLVLYAGVCGLQFALPRLHAWAPFQFWRARIRQIAFAIAISAVGVGTVRLFAALRAEHLPMTKTAIAAVSLALGMWLLRWTTAVTKEDQAKFAKLAAFSVSVLIGLFYLLHNGSRLFGRFRTPPC